MAGEASRSTPRGHELPWNVVGHERVQCLVEVAGQRVVAHGLRRGPPVDRTRGSERCAGDGDAGEDIDKIVRTVDRSGSEHHDVERQDHPAQD